MGYREEAKQSGGRWTLEGWPVGIICWQQGLGLVQFIDSRVITSNFIIAVVSQVGWVGWERC